MIRSLFLFAFFIGLGGQVVNPSGGAPKTCANSNNYPCLNTANSFTANQSTTGSLTVLSATSTNASGIKIGSANYAVADFNSFPAVVWGNNSGVLNYWPAGLSVNTLTIASNAGLAVGSLTVDGASGLITMPLMPNNGTPQTVASATTIAPTAPQVVISGTTAIATITVPGQTTSSCFDILATGAWTTTTAGNIQATMTASANQIYRACYWPGITKWVIK